MHCARTSLKAPPMGQHLHRTFGCVLAFPGGCGVIVVLGGQCVGDTAPTSHNGMSPDSIRRRCPSTLYIAEHVHVIGIHALTPTPTTSKH